MPRDTQSLRLLRFRYDSLLHPVPLTDSRMDRILSIPPIQRVRVVEVTEADHNRVTRSTADCVVTEEPIVEEAPKNANAEEAQRLAEERLNRAVLMPITERSLRSWITSLLISMLPSLSLGDPSISILMYRTSES